MKETIGKVERLISATYMATNHISDNDEAKRQVRASAVKVMASVIDLSEVYNRVAALANTEDDWQRIIKDIDINVSKVLSFIKILISDKQMSGKNADLLSMSFMRLISFINNADMPHMMSDKAALSDMESLSYMRFETDRAMSQTDRIDRYNRAGVVKKNATVDNFNHKINENNILSPGAGINRVNDSKGERQAKIISIIKSMDANGANMGELIGFMTGVSEKTLQRDLQSMIEAQLVIRNGEKRWSRYVLAPTLL